ncbi:MAG: hypothetical protein RMJ19_02945, partial [Gemmatales bacterium]|nr:hypothetical protein [Gemmatales bacterium]MDW8174605.1 hypothetical protein [Gemmatales bacterium]
MEQFAIDRDLKATAGPWHEHKFLQFILQGSEHLARQTDGPRFVVSLIAVFKPYLHPFTPFQRVRFVPCR